MTNKPECAALAVLHEAIGTEFRQGEIYDAVESIKFNGPFLRATPERLHAAEMRDLLEETQEWVPERILDRIDDLLNRIAEAEKEQG